MRWLSPSKDGPDGGGPPAPAALSCRHSCRVELARDLAQALPRGVFSAYPHEHLVEVGWGVNIVLARIRGEWRIVELGFVYP